MRTAFLPALAAAVVACGRAPARSASDPSTPADAAVTTDRPGAAAEPTPDASVDASIPIVAPTAATVPPGWVDLATVVPDAVLDLRYATAHNLTGAPLYPVARCLLRAPVAARLVRAADLLRARGHRLVVWDCYRPVSIQRVLWARVPDRRYVAEPRFDASGQPIAGSKHSRGAAVDVSLADEAGALREMPTDHDDFTPAARARRVTGSTGARLAALRAAMVAAGFAPIETEWWHFDARDGTRFPFSDEPLR